MAALIIFLLAVGIVIGLLVKIRRVLETVYRQIAHRREALGLSRLTNEVSIWAEPGRLWVQIAEIQEAEKQAALRASNTQFVLTALLEGMLEGVLVVDAHGKIRAANEPLRRMFGVTSEILGRSLPEAFRNKDLFDIFQRALEEGQVLHHTMEISSPAQCMVEVNASVVRDPQRKANGTVIVLHDQTRLRHLETTRKQFVANVSHEIRTPLTMVKGYLEALDENPDMDNAQRRQVVRVMQRNAERISNLISDLLVLSKLEGSDQRETMESVDVHGLLAEVNEEFQSVCRKKDIELNMPERRPNRMVRGNPVRLRQVMDNLLDNAVRYSPPHTSITVRAELVDAWLQISVSDQGCGISESDLPHVFERFYRAEKSRARDASALETHSGTGLGLSIVQQIVQQHGGRVWVRSELGKGATFTFTIPLGG